MKRGDLSRLARFRIYPDLDKRFSFDVHVFRSKRSMYAFYREQSGQLVKPDKLDSGLDFLAICCPWRSLHVHKDLSVTEGRGIGSVLFCKRSCRVGIVSHELLHATIHWADLTFLLAAMAAERAAGRDNQIEERICWAHGYLVAQFWRKLPRFWIKK